MQSGFHELACMTSLTSSTGLFTVYRASAGSGKTYALVREYLVCCLRYPQANRYRHILAITFTNKAAGEMKQRVLDYLAALETGSKSDLEQELCERIEVSASELRLRAGKALRHMLHHYGEVSIMTIDRFVNRLVRSFSRDLQLNSDYRIELDQNRILQEAVDRLLDQVGEDEDLTRVLELYVLDRVEDEANWRIRDALVQFGSTIFKEEVVPYLNRLSGSTPQDFLEVQERLRTEVKQLEHDHNLLARSAYNGLEEHGLQIEDFAYKALPYYLKGFFNGKWEPPGSRLQGQLDNEVFWKGSADSTTQDAILGWWAAYKDKVQYCVDFSRSEERGKFYLKRLLVNKLFQIAVLEAMAQEASEYQEEQNTRTFSDLNRLISELVRNNPAPYIFERIGTRYNHFLIDEFQDTSVMQWQNLLPLFEEALGHGHFNLIVGDGKQAIYRWRNGDVRQFQQMPTLIGSNLTPEMVERQRSLERHHTEKVLDQNWRSAKSIVEFNNSLYNSLRSKLSEEHLSIFDNQEQEAKRRDEGFVKVHVVEGKTTKERLEERHRLILEKVHAAQAAELRLRDIAILLRTNREASELASFLLSMGIQPITEESLKLEKHPAIIAILSLLRFFAYPDDERPKMKFLQSMVQVEPELDHMDLLVKYRKEGKKKEGRGRTRTTFDLGLCLREEWAELDPHELAGMRLYTAVEKIIDALRLGAVAPAYCEMFLQHVLEYSSSENEGINGFLKYWEQSGYKASIRVPETAEGVQILTIHKAKGLEFPVVIFPLAWHDWGRLRNDLPVWLDAEEYGLDAAFLPYSKNAGDHAVKAQWDAEKQRQLLDELNVCYVATTRARDQLHLLLEMKDLAKAGGEEAPVSEWVFEALQQTHGFDPSNGPLELGDPTPYSTEEMPTVAEHVNNLKRGNLEDRLQISFDKEQMALGPGVLSPRAIGDEVHDLLAGIRSMDDLPTLETRSFPWNRMDEATWEHMVSVVKEVVKHPSAAEWFSPDLDVACERELISADGKLLRPDRLVFKGDDVHVIDYKTGEPSESHKKQMLQYAQAMQGLVEGSVYASLFYTDKMRRVDVPVTPTLF